MNSLFLQPAQVETLNFETFTSEYVAEKYNVTENNLRQHKRLHADELVENIHFTTKKNKFGTNEVKWTLKGIVVLGFFIRSPQAKNFRIWASNKLEEQIRQQAKAYEQTRLQSIEQQNRIANLEAIQIRQNKHYQSVTNGYKSTFAKQKSKLEVLKAQLVVADDKAKNPDIASNDELRKRLEHLVKCTVVDAVCKALRQSEKDIIDRALKIATDDFFSNLHLLKG